MILIIYEAIIVGLYSLFIGFFIDIINLSVPLYVKLFIIGYIKHILAYYLNLHTYYCNNGYSCISTNKKRKAINDYLLIDSLYDSILFVILGLLLILIIKYKFIYYFLIGFIAHISSEYFLFHKFFCKNRCI